MSRLDEERQADALERIATALERLVEHHTPPVQYTGKNGKVLVSELAHDEIDPLQGMTYTLATLPKVNTMRGAGVRAVCVSDVAPGTLVHGYGVVQPGGYLTVPPHEG